ncbi:protein translocase subunit SecD [Vulgatibacter incomptus]|uniref:protein translocase subunit SecD n=1 Tax=Vulgatibacter incomptus TaxID=1391653 RepID=UPI000680B9D4|nr:protein translocase subunit SecD [Vulgatibacter incomptus]
MERSWYVRLWIVLAVVLSATYLLIPTFVYFTLPAEVRNDKDAFEAALPGWAPKKRINLGLDLQGGVHLVLGVDLDKAVKDKVVRRADEMRTFATEKKLSVQSIQANRAKEEILVSFASDADADAFRTAAQEFFGDMHRSGGGTASRYAFDAEYLKRFKEGALDQALRTIRNRIDKWGVSEPTIAKRGSDGILVQLPGFKDPEKAKELLGRTAQLEFRIVADSEASSLVDNLGALPDGITKGSDGYQAYLQSTDRQALEHFVDGKAPEGLAIATSKVEARDAAGLAGAVSYRTYVLRSKTEITGDKLTDARVAVDQSGLGGGKPYVSLSFDPEGARAFEQLTGANIGKRLAIVLDGNVDSAPVVQSKIAGGSAQITLGGNRNYNQLIEEANELSLVLRSGALPAPVSIFEERTVGASLGPELIRSGATASVVGLLLVLLFMAVYYKLTGVIADVALVLNGLLILAALGMVGATLTLPGIAGFILTLGMAVDANVLINERIREELRHGKNSKVAIKEGYGRAFATIFDGHVTTLVAAFVLLQYGTGPIRGFAVTLIIGLVASLFTSIVVTRLVKDRLYQGRPGEVISV